MELVDVFATHVINFVDDFKEYQSLMNINRDLRQNLYLKPTITCLYLYDSKKNIWQKIDQFKYNHLITQAIIIINSLPKYSSYVSINRITLNLNELFPLLRSLKIIVNKDMQNKIKIKFPSLLNALSVENVKLSIRDLQSLTQLYHFETNDNINIMEVPLYLHLNDIFIKYLKCVYSDPNSLNAYRGALIDVFQNNDYILTTINNYRKLTEGLGYDIKILNKKPSDEMFNDTFVKVVISNNHYYYYKKYYVKQIIDSCGEYRLLDNLFPNIENYN